VLQLWPEVTQEPSGCCVWVIVDVVFGAAVWFAPSSHSDWISLHPSPASGVIGPGSRGPQSTVRTAGLDGPPPAGAGEPEPQLSFTADSNPSPVAPVDVCETHDGDGAAVRVVAGAHDMRVAVSVAMPSRIMTANQPRIRANRHRST
jgi:hypothetical protein